ncbi:hypothetical protein [Citrobacter amalonaticus]|uniref:hypothetical protein n=1 Tax=Citrobacter amalonaticus TaxID=35703 RepID=UPI0022E277F6|nr:hypothetical protein [Citrobacter amalonaticus]
MIRDEHEKIIDNNPLAINAIGHGGSQHPFQKLSEQLADEAAEREWLRKTVPSNNIQHFNPEPVDMPEIGKNEQLLNLEREYYPLLKEQKIKLDFAYDTVIRIQSLISEPDESDISFEIKQNKSSYYSCDWNNGWGVPSDMINKIPEGHRMITVEPAPQGRGFLVFTTDKTDEEIQEVARQVLMRRFERPLNDSKKILSKELQEMKQLVKEYEDARKTALQADIEQLTKISTKYSKVL